MIVYVDPRNNIMNNILNEKMIEHIKQKILEFLADAKPGVIVLKGAWGTGKTYAWNTWLKESIDKKKIGPERYAYVSLFGCTSLDELKAQTFYELLPVDLVTKGVNIDTVAENIEEATENKRWSKLLTLSGIGSKKLKEIPVLRNITVDVWRVGWTNLNNTLICIDDLERKSDGLTVKDVFGLVSVLKEQKNCKVILILNDESILGENKKDYEDYREKVVDVELHFDPESQNLVRYVIDETHPHFNTICDRISRLRVKNIRTMQKIKTYLDKLSRSLEGVTAVHYENVISSVILFTVLNFSKPDKWPTLDQVLNANMQQFFMIDSILMDAEKQPETESVIWAKAMNLLKENYIWHGADDIDQVLGQFVKQGYLEVAALKQLIAAAEADLEKETERELAHARTNKVSELLFHTLDDNLSDILKAMEESIEGNIRLYPALGELNAAVTYLKTINQPVEASKLISKYIELAKNLGSNRLNPESYDEFYSGPLDEDIRSQILKPFEELRNLETEHKFSNLDRQKIIADVSERCPNYNVNKEDFETLSYFNAVDFEHFLRNTKINKQVKAFLEVFLLHEKPLITDCIAYHQTIRTTLAEAIRAIIKGSDLNKFRLRKYVSLIETLPEKKPET